MRETMRPEGFGSTSVLACARCKRLDLAENNASVLCAVAISIHEPK
jgi:hypothetical protein